MIALLYVLGTSHSHHSSGGTSGTSHVYHSTGGSSTTTHVHDSSVVNSDVTQRYHSASATPLVHTTGPSKNVYLHTNKNFNKHIIATNVIASYLVWGSFSDAVYNTFLHDEKYYSFNLYYYNKLDNCLYYSKLLNNDNETKINGTDLIFLNGNDVNEIVNETNIEIQSMVKFYNLKKFCQKNDESYLLYIMLGYLFMAICCMCSCFNRETFKTNRTPNLL